MGFKRKPRRSRNLMRERLGYTRRALAMPLAEAADARAFRSRTTVVLFLLPFGRPRFFVKDRIAGGLPRRCSRLTASRSKFSITVITWSRSTRSAARTSLTSIAPPKISRRDFFIYTFTRPAVNVNFWFMCLFPQKDCAAFSVNYG
jgi:hypothetical protein